MHFLVQAAAPALAPLAPHLESLTQPFTVSDLAASSAKTTATWRKVIERIRHNSSSFFMAALLSVLAAEAAGFPETALMRFRCKRSGLSTHPMELAMQWQVTRHLPTEN